VARDARDRALRRFFGSQLRDEKRDRAAYGFARVFLEKAEAILGRVVQPKRPGGKPKAVEQNRQLILWRRNSQLIGAADE
jgi:hypothetical protein